MSGYLARLGEKAVGTEPVVMPLIAPLYGNAPALRSLVPAEADASAASEPALREELVEHGQGAVRQQPQVEVAGSPAAARAVISRMQSSIERRETALERGEARVSHQRTTLERNTPLSVRSEKLQHDTSDEQRSRANPMLPAVANWSSETHGAHPHARRPALPDAEHAPSETSQGHAPFVKPAAHLELLREKHPLHQLPREMSDSITGLDAMLSRLRALSLPQNARDDQAAHTPAAPVVRISIGRIEVRAAPAPHIAQPPVRAERKPTGPTLAEYLSKRPRATP